MDIVNGFFEFFGGLLVILNIKAILKHKTLKGVHPIPTLYFTLWGVWNLFYYPSLGQWYSFVGGSLVVVLNLVWLLCIIKVKKEDKNG